MTGVEILGIAKAASIFLKQGYDAIKWTYDKYKHFAHAGTELFELNRMFETITLSFQAWLKKWSFEFPTPEWLLEGCWGSEEYKNICLQVRGFEESTRNFEKELRNVLGSDSRQALKRDTTKVAENHSEILLSKSQRSRSEDKLELEESLEITERLKHAWEGEDGFLKRLNDLERRYRDLEDVSNRFFKYKDPAEGEMAVFERFRVVMDSKRTSQAHTTGLPSEELYAACVRYTEGPGRGRADEQQSEDHSTNATATGVSACSCKVHLELDLPAKNKGEHSLNSGTLVSTLALLDFQLLLQDPSTDTRLKLLFEGPFTSMPNTSSKKPLSFEKAVQTIQLTNEFYDIQTTNSYFRVSRVSGLAGENGKSICLRNLFQKANSRPDKQPSTGFWIEDQFRLALKVVEVGLYLLGTSWLSNLSTAAVLRVTSVDNPDPRYILHLTRWVIPYQNAKLPHLFRIGIVLAEIALLETLVEAKDMPERHDGPQGISGIEHSYYIFTNSGPSSGGLKDTVEYPFCRMISIIKERTTPMVGRAVEFCLKAESVNAFSASETLPPNESDYEARIKAYGKVLGDYREQVYNP
jgi:hypothetical protein